MEINIFQVDAFSNRVFRGNPAAVCPLDAWIDDDILQSIAAENALSETAFFVPSESPMYLRWFTPTVEVDLCGHATLATAHVLNHHLGNSASDWSFNSRSGLLKVLDRGNSTYTLDFPLDNISRLPQDHPIAECFDQDIQEVCQGKADMLLRLDSQEAVERCSVDFGRLKDMPGRGVLVTAEGTDCDYVARCFFPQSGVDEDPATGSSHTTLALYWSQQLGKEAFSARQLSPRGGHFKTEINGNRVLITGSAVSYLEGVIRI